MEIGNIQAQQPISLGANRSASEFPVVQKSQAETPVKVPATDKVEFRATDQQRMEAIRRAVEQAKDLFAVSDTSFTIFKDAAGQFVTRFTNLRDGSITYYPEPELVKRLDTAGIDTSLIKVNA